jgi:hypothetical protein
MADEKNILITGTAVPKARRARKTRRTTGGDNSGALLQVAGQGQASGLNPGETQTVLKDYQTAVASALQQLPLLNQKGGMNGAIVNLTSTRAPITPGSSAPVGTVSGQPVEEPAPAMLGGVILKPHKKHARVSLKAPKKGPVGSSVPATRKAPRKIRLGVKGLKTRINRAKKAHSHAQTVSLPIVKQRLVRAGVIKASSKAPEPMLRSMYADLLVTKKGL